MTVRFRPGKLAWKLLGLIVSISIALILLREVDFNSFARMVARVPAWSLGAALVAYLLLNFFRLLRFRTLLEQHDIPAGVFYAIVLYHNFLVRVLPFKTGEISYVVLLRQHLNQPLRDGVSSLVSSRLFELFMVIVIGGGALLLATDLIHLPWRIALLIVFVGGAVYLAGLYFSGALLHWLAGLIRRVGVRLGSPQLIARGDKMLNALAASFDRVRRPRVFATTLFLSIFTYGMSALFYLVLLYAVGVDANPALLVAVVSIVMLAEALPLATISGLGVIEGGWVFGLVTLAGFDIGPAASIGFFLHGCQIVAAVTTGLIGYLWLQISRRADLAARLEQGGLDVKRG
jgi:glycosyltransferase 2 family protein